MALVIGDFQLEVAFHHALTGSLHDIVCTLGLQHGGVYTTANLDAVAQGWGETMTRSMADVFTATHATFRSALGTVYDKGQGNQGGTSHPPASVNCAFLIKKVTNRPGRRGRGRLYLPGVSEQDVDALGIVSSSKVTEINNNILDFLTRLSAAGFAPVLLHNESQDPAVDTDANTITSMSCEGQIATQRDRMR